MRDQEVHAKALRIRAFWSEIGRTPGRPACETPSLVKAHTRECKTCQDAWDESCRTASAEEAKRGVVGDPDTGPLDPSGSSMDPEPKRTKTTSVTENENLADQMDEDNFQRTPGKLQYVTGVRPDLLFVTKCLSYKLASPTLADLTRAKKVLRYLKGTRELNLYLTIPALKPNDLNMTVKNVTEYSDADWAGDPVTRKGTSCTLFYFDQFLLTSECR